MFIKNPIEIEQRSMEIITEELGPLNFLPEEQTVVKRIIHATADLELADLIRIAPGAIDLAIKSLKKGAQVVTDVAMVQAGVNRRLLTTYGGEVRTHIADPDVIRQAKIDGITRAMAAMRKAVSDSNNKIFLIGNAPTALFELLRLIRADRLEVDLIIGTPVGFVGASESKAELLQSDLPFITVQGRKGGSAVAAAALNAILSLSAGRRS